MMRSLLAVVFVSTAFVAGCGGGHSDESAAGHDGAAGAEAAASASSAVAAGGERHITSNLQGADVSVTWRSARTASVSVVSPEGVESTSVLVASDHGADVYSVGTLAPNGSMAVSMPEPGTSAGAYLSIRLKSGNTVELPL